MSDTPRTDELANREFVPDGLWIRHARELERENAELRELTATLGAPNHVGVPVPQWRELRADKERLDWLLNRGVAWRDCYDGHWQATEWLYMRQNGRAAIDAARKETRP